jgi:excisionase family DNA binding protein
MGIGNVLGQALQGMQASKEAGVPIPDVMTPAEAANIMKVTEDDVLAAINSGDLKAKKIGKAFRISKEALDDFLQG